MEESFDNRDLESPITGQDTVPEETKGRDKSERTYKIFLVVELIEKPDL
jgi:hypothetical protein